MGTKFKIYHNLMPYRVREILIVSSPYDAFIMEEDGGLLEHVFMRIRGVSLIEPPKITVVTNYKQALESISQKSFDLVVIMPKILKPDVIKLGKSIKDQHPNITVILLVHSAKSLTLYKKKIPKNAIDQVFIWSGNRNILWTILKWSEDKINTPHDTEMAMVRVLILIEDSPSYYSSILPILYQSIVRQTKAVLDDSLNEEHRLMKLRARTKILLANNYEEAMELYIRYRPYLLGIFSDIRFPKGGKIDPEAGIKFLSFVKNELPDLSLLLLSTEKANISKAKEIFVRFQDKNSPSLHLEIRRFLVDYMGFGDFIFRMPNGVEVSRASNLVNLEKVLKTVTRESLRYHVMLNHFSNWLLARSEISLATKFRSLDYYDFANLDELRKRLVSILTETRSLRQKGIILSFKKDGFDPEMTFLKIDEGSLGGKARGLAFMVKHLQQNSAKLKKISNISILIPRTLVLSTDCFDDFMEDNNFEDFTEVEYSDQLVAQLFTQAKLPKNIEEDLRAYLAKVTYPIAIRSSSLLEDSKDEPFAGLYSTYMLPNNHPNINERYRQLSMAIRLVYASIFYESPKAFSKSTQHRTEEEKMGVLIQEVIGSHYGELYYPAISGTAQSHNFYPLNFMKASEGIANLSIGFGKIIVERGQTLRFSPKYPKNIAQFSTVDDILSNCQKSFFALNMKIDEQNDLKWLNEETNYILKDIDEATNDYPIKFLSSSYLQEDHVIRDSFISGSYPVVTFANILKHNKLHLAQLLSTILKIGKEGFGCDVEMEFAINLSQSPDTPHQFYLLQARPLTTSQSDIYQEITQSDIKQALCYSTNALGQDDYEDINNIIIVKPDKFNSSSSILISKEVSKLNAKLKKQNKKFLLIGPGRWGSADHCLGIPVAWNDISNVSAIIEATIPSVSADPSQGTHFFQNITALGITYITIFNKSDFLNWEWFFKQEIVEQTDNIAHIYLDHPLILKIDGRKNQGVILKPNNTL